MVEILCGVTSSLRQGMQETTAYTEVDHRRPKLGGAIYKTLYESLTRFRRLLENGPKYRNKDEFWSFLGRFDRFFSFDRWKV